jgi:AraC-like DNA-binding protein
VCSAGPHDEPFEERHDQAAIAIIVGGTFQYRASQGEALMVPGTLLLGNAGEHFLCRHDHGTGDRCVAFQYAPDVLARLAEAAGSSEVRFVSARVSPGREVTRLLTSVSELLLSDDPTLAEILSVEVASCVARLERALPAQVECADAPTLARVTRVVRLIEHECHAPLDLQSLARLARLSPYHFIRTFRAAVGATPHQYLRRLRLRRAALRLRTATATVADVAFECGFGDISTFNRAFRREFGATPRVFRARA